MNKPLKWRIALENDLAVLCDKEDGTIPTIAIFKDEQDAKLGAAAPELRQALSDVVADLFYQIESKHGPKAASEYPSIAKAKELLSKIK